MRISQLSLISITLFATATASASGVSIGKNGIQVGGLSIGNDGVNVPSSVSIGNNVDNYDAETTSESFATVDSSFHCSSSQPNAYVSGVNRKVSITGTCSSIKVSGTNLQITANKAHTLTESGANNVVDIAKVNKVIVKGTNSTVSYNSNYQGKSAITSATGVNSDIDRN